MNKNLIELLNEIETLPTPLIINSEQGLGDVKEAVEYVEEFMDAVHDVYP